MKHIYAKPILLLVTVALAVVSCNKKNDTSSSSSLSGTVWKYNYSDVVVKSEGKNEGGGLKFMSETTVVVIDWEIEKNGQYVEDAVVTGKYEYTEPEGVLILPTSSHLFKVSGNKLTVSNFDDAAQVVMTRQ